MASLMTSQIQSVASTSPYTTQSVLFGNEMLILSCHPDTPSPSPDHKRNRGQSYGDGQTSQKDKHIVHSHTVHPRCDSEDETRGNDVSNEHHTRESVTKNLEMTKDTRQRTIASCLQEEKENSKDGRHSHIGNNPGSKSKPCRRSRLLLRQ